VALVWGVGRKTEVSVVTMQGFWEAIDEQLAKLKTAANADEVLAILPAAGMGADGFFAGGGGDYTPADSLVQAGWRTIWAEAPYHYAMRAPDGSAITYVEGDIYRGDRRVAA
jgi:hypothetical protein